MPFNHENLSVYQRTLPFNARVGDWTDAWDGRHAVCDQLSRASGSVLENIATASAADTGMKRRGMDYAIGSTLECAACMDLVGIKRLLDADAVYGEKKELSEILRMLVGLRKAWSGSSGMVREDSPEYAGGSGRATGRDNGDGKAWDAACRGESLFHHETLDVYRVAIKVAEAFCASEDVSRLSNRVFRRLDDLLTSMVLNIAEGNGRFSAADQARFLGTSHESAVKLAARLDLCVMRKTLSREEVAEWKLLLERVSLMTRSMMGRLRR